MERARTRAICSFCVTWGVVLAAVSAGALPKDVGSGALFAKSADGSFETPLPLLETEVELKVTGMAVRARVVQRFRNPSDRWLEGIYVFPLPELAAVDHLDLRVGSRVIEGQIQEREEAKKTYTKAKREGRRASLVEQERPNLFTTRVANLGPGEEVEVAIEYQEALRYERGSYRLRFPMAVTPRFTPGPALPVIAPQPSPVSGITLVSTGAEHDQCIDFPVLHPDAGPAHPTRVRVELEPGFPLAELHSPTHVVAVYPKGADGAHLVELDDYPDRDFVLEWRPQAGAEPRAALFSETRGDRAYALLMVMPPDAEAGAASLRREVVFVIDTSGSMGGASIEQARASLLLALEQLDAGDHFNVIEFDDQTEKLFPASVPATPRHLELARRRVRGLRANGGTHMLPALAAALSGDAGHGDLRQVVFITDGSIGNEAQLFAAIERDLGRSRLFPVGIGSAPNGHFLSRAAKHGRGTHTLIANPGEVDAKMGALFAKLESPVLSDIEVLWNDEVQMWPHRVPDLYAGEPVVVTAELSRFAGDVVVRGRRGDRPWQVRLPLEPGEAQRGIGVLWARRKIAAGMEALALGADPDAVRVGVLAVALEHHLVSRYTSLVAVDVTPVRPLGELLASGPLPLNLPAGMQAPQVGALPQAGTPAALLRALGAVLMLVASGLGTAGRRRRRPMPDEAQRRRQRPMPADAQRRTR